MTFQRSDPCSTRHTNGVCTLDDQTIYLKQVNMNTRTDYSNILKELGKQIEAGLTPQEILGWVRNQSEIEKLNYAQVDLLDHGYVRPIEFWGSDERIIESARQSTDGGFVSWGPYEDHLKGDMGLLSYLYRNKHSTPFEFSGLTIEVQAPIMVFREWHRHRTQSYTEMSARYTPLPDLYYMPTQERLLINATVSNKQAGRADDAAELTVSAAEEFRKSLGELYSISETLYQEALRQGIPKELARCGMPVGHYSRMRATANLRNWLAFLTLRMDMKAQWEIRMYAQEVAKILRKVFPRTMELFDEKN